MNERTSHDDLRRDIEQAHQAIRDMRGSIGELFSQYRDLSLELKEQRTAAASDRKDTQKALSAMREELKSYYENLAKLLATQAAKDVQPAQLTQTNNVLLYVVLGVVLIQLLIGWLR